MFSKLYKSIIICFKKNFFINKLFKKKIKKEKNIINNLKKSSL